MHMPAITDPQLARVLERIEHIAKVVDRLEPLAISLNTVQRDHEHLADTVKGIKETTRVHRQLTSQIDRRTLVLERWHKFMVGLSATGAAAVLWAAGYVTNYFKSLDADANALNNRVTTLEYVFNSPNFEKATREDRPVSTGKK